LAADAAIIADLVRTIDGPVVLVPAAVHHFMAERAGVRRAVAVPGAPRAIAVTQP
jgi:hypothetical protein